MKQFVTAAVLLASAGVLPILETSPERSGSTPSHFLASQRVGQVDAENAYHAEQQRGEKAIERKGQRSPSYHASLVNTRPHALGGPWIAWYGVAAVLCIGFGWSGLLLGRRRLLSGALFYGGLSALFYIAYAVTH